MKNKETVAREFAAKLKHLLEEYGAEIEASDNSCGNPERGDRIEIEVTIPSAYTEAGETVSEYTAINFGQYISQSHQTYSIQ